MDSNRRERHRRELRERILDAAEELFARSGQDKASMRKIAARIEYTPTTIYRFFRNKDELLHALIKRGYDRVHRMYETIEGRNEISPLRTLKMILEAYIDFALKNPNHYRFWFQTSDLEVRNGEMIMTHEGSSYRVYQTWLRWITLCADQGLLVKRDLLEMFQILWVAVHGYISLRIQHPRFPWSPATDLLEQTIAMIRPGGTPKEEQ